MSEADQPYEVPQASGSMYLQNCMFDPPSNVSNMCHMWLMQLPLLEEVMHVLGLLFGYTETAGFCYSSRSVESVSNSLVEIERTVETIVLNYSGRTSDCFGSG